MLLEQRRVGILEHFRYGLVIVLEGVVPVRTARLDLSFCGLSFQETFAQAAFPHRSQGDDFLQDFGGFVLELIENAHWLVSFREAL